MLNTSKNVMALSALLASLSVTSRAVADDASPAALPPAPPVVIVAAPPSPPVEPAPRHRWIGVQFDVGAPDGVALGLVVRPAVDWLRVEAAITDNVLAPGGRLGLTLDPIKFPIVPTATIEGGFTGSGKIPGKGAEPTVAYDYVNLHLGLEVGNRDRWRLFLHTGPSYIHLSTGNFESAVGSSLGNATLANPTANVWFTPTAKLGFALYF